LFHFFLLQKLNFSQFFFTFTIVATAADSTTTHKQSKQHMYACCNDKYNNTYTVQNNSHITTTYVTTYNRDSFLKYLYYLHYLHYVRTIYISYGFNNKIYTVHNKCLISWSYKHIYIDHHTYTLTQCTAVIHAWYSYTNLIHVS